MKFKSKSLISIILSIMMVISMIIVAIPANAVVINSNSVGADTTYYLWYGSNDNIANKNGNDYSWTKSKLEAVGDGTYTTTLSLTTGSNCYFSVNTDSLHPNTTSSTWSNSNDVENNISYAEGFPKSSSGVQQYGANNYNNTSVNYFYPRFALSRNANVKFTFTPEKTIVVSEAGSTPSGSTVATTTTPSTSEWYLIGGSGSANFGNWDKSNKSYPLTGTGTVLTKSVTFDANTTTYFRFHDTAKQYSLDKSDNAEIGDENNQKYLVEDDSKAIYFSNNTDSPLTVNICLDTSTRKVWYESATAPTEPTTTEPVETTVPPTTAPVGDYTITDATEINGSLSFSADGRTAGRANENDTVTITANPAYPYFELDTVTVTGADNSSIEVTDTGTTRTFKMPAKNVTAKATFKLNKSAYIKSLNEDGLWIDVAPDKYDTTATLIKWNNYTGNNQNNRGSYIFYVPKNVDLTKANIYNGYGNAVTLNNKSIPSDNMAEVSLVKDTSYTTLDGVSASVMVMQGSTNAMFLHTTDNTGADYDLPTKIDDSLTSKSKVETSGGSCTTMVYDGTTSTVSSAMALDTVKGRGNSSWEASYKFFGKYAFNMKLASKTKLFGMDNSKSWCLLANNADESMMRNALTYQLAAEIGIQDSPEFRFVDIYDNGEYLGAYLITEKVDVGNSKLVKGKSFEDINEDGAKAEGATGVSENLTPSTYTYTYQNGTTYTPEMRYAQVSPNSDTSDESKYPYKTKGKYLLEFEIKKRYTAESSYFTSPQGQHVVVKSPEFATKQQVEYIAKKFAAMEEIAFTSGATHAQLSTVMDVESFAKMYLIQELSSNLDSAATSYYVTFDCAQSDPVFVANPVWDYDWAYGQYSNSAKKDVNGNTLKTDEPTGNWVAKIKSYDDGEITPYKYSLQSQLANNNSEFKSVIRKVWEEKGGFYENIKKYYTGEKSQIDKWYDQIAASVDMNETRWGIIAGDVLQSKQWGSNDTGDTHADAVNYLENTWTAARAAWLNTQFTTTAEYKTYTPDAPTIKLYAADGKTETSAVEKGKGFIIKVTSPLESNVTYRFFKEDVTLVSDQSDGVLEFATDDLTVGETYTYYVKAVYNGKASDASTPVSIRIDDKAGNKQVTIYFKSASASAYVPSLSIDGASSAVMTRNKQGDANSTYFGSTYSGSLKFYWFYTKVTLDTSVEHTLKFTTKDNRVNASTSYEFVASEGNNYYFAVDNLMGDTNLINLTGEKEYIRNYHISATHMVHSTTYDNNVGFTWMKDNNGNYKEYAMGTYLKENDISTASLTDLTSSSLLTIPSALTPNAMLQASTAPSFFTVKSATLAQRITAEAEEVSTLQYQLLDVNLDGVVDVKDSTMMQKALAGL